MTSPKPRLKRFLVSLSALILLIAIVVAIHSLVAITKLRAVHKELQRHNFPLTWDQYVEKLNISDSQAAATSNLWTALDAVSDVSNLSREEMSALPVEGFAAMPELGAPWPDNLLAAMDARLQQVAPALSLLREALIHESFSPLHIPGPDGDTAIAHLSAARQAARWFRMSAILHAERGDAEAAAQSVMDGIRLAHALSSGSLIIDDLVRFACEGLALESLKHLLARTDPSETALSGIDDLLQLNPPLSGWKGEIVFVAVMGARVRSEMSASEIRDFIAWHDGKSWYRVIPYLPGFTGWLRMNEAYHLQMLHEIIKIDDLSWPEYIERYENSLETPPRFYFLNRMALEGLHGVKNRAFRIQGARRCGRIAIAIERYVGLHGRLPDKLIDLKPEIGDLPLTDPFYNNPLEYQLTGEKAIISFDYLDDQRHFEFPVFMPGYSIDPEIDANTETSPWGQQTF